MVKMIEKLEDIKMLYVFVKWLFFAFALLLIDAIMPGIKLAGFFAALWATLMIGAINIVLKPIVNFIALPINILTFGLFTFIINALLFMLAAAIVPGFSVDGFFTALIGSMLFSFLSMIINLSGSTINKPKFS